MGQHEYCKPGTALPDIVLKNHHNKEVRFTDFMGRKILLSFHPLAWTKVCAQQMKSLEATYDIFAALNTIAFGISVDSVPTKHAWARHDLKITRTQLLSDFWPHGAFAKQLGLFRQKEGFSERANILFDEEHKVNFVKVYDIPQFPDIEEILRILKK